MMAEFKRREKKKLNIVITGIQVVSGKTDVEVLTDLFNTELKFIPHITKTIRLGGGKSGSPPLLLASLRDTDDKRDITKLAKNLCTSSNAHVKDKVYINHDCTLVQCQENFALRGTLKTRRAAGEKDLRIRGGKIIHVTTSPSAVKATSVTTAP